MPASQTPTDAHRVSTLAEARFPERVRAALEAVLRVASDELERRLEGMLVEFEQQLFRLADHARSPAIEAGHLQTLRNMRLNRADLIPRFMLGVEAGLAGIGQPLPTRAAATVESPFPGLALVDSTELDAELVLRDIAQRSEAGASLALHLLGQRFGVLAAAPAFDAQRLPLGPQALCRVMEEASQSLQLPPDTSHLLLRTFERKVMVDYAELAEQFNATLAAEGVLPALTYVPLRVRPGAAGSEAAPASVGARRSRRPVARSRTAPRGQPHTAWYPPDEPDEGGGDAAFGMLQELLGARERPRRGTPTPAARETVSRQPLDTGDLVDALARLTPLVSGSAPPAQGIAALKRDVLARIRSEHGADAGLARADSDTFDLLDMLYQRIERDVRVDTLAAALLQRLQLPVLQTALRDHGFFARAQHPARQLLNTVAESGARWMDENDADPALHEPLKRAVEHVVRNAHEGTAAFEAGNRVLQQELHAQARRSELAERRHIEAARGKEKLEVAKQQATEAIAGMIGERKPHRFVRALIEQAWADVLTLVLLRHGSDSDEWRQMQDTTQRIVAACCDSEPVPDPALSGQIETALLTVGYHAEEAAAIGRRLTSVRDDDDDATSRTQLAASLKARARLGGQSGEASRKRLSRTPEEEAQYERVRTLPFGTWIEFITNQQGDVVRKRLSWYSSVTGNALFVNVRGQRMGEQSLDSVARALARGQARVVTAERARLVDRAWQSTLGALRSLARGRTRKTDAGSKA